MIVSVNLIRKFQPKDLLTNKAAKSFTQNKYNDWFDFMCPLLLDVADPINVKISSKLSQLKPLHVR